VYNARVKRAFQSGFFFLCVLFTAAGAFNVLSDNAEVEHLAQEVACGGGPKMNVKGGNPQKTRMERTPIAQTFDFVTSKRTVTVRCTRSALLVGEYGCELH